MNALHGDMNALRGDITQLSNDISSVQGKMSEIRSDVIDLKTENVEIKKELEHNSYNTEKKIKDLAKSLMKRIDGVNDRVVLVERTIESAPNAFSNAIKDTDGKLMSLRQVSNHSTEAKSASTPAFDNADGEAPSSMVAPGNASSTTINETPVVVESISDNSSAGDAIARALAQQTRFNTAMALGRSPSMIFQGELYKYVQFVTMFRGTFDKTIADPVSLFEILLRHTKGPAKAAIESCIFSPPEVNRYEEAMSILKSRYGQKQCVIKAHRERLLIGKVLVDSIADFEVLSNELKCYCSVLEHFSVDMQYYSC